MKRNLIVRIVAIIMAALMLLGVVSLIFNVAMAADVGTAVATGSEDIPKWIIIALICALAVIVGCVVVPRIKNKKD